MGRSPGPKDRHLATKLLSAAFVLLVAFGGLYVVFAQGFAVGAYQDLSCTMAASSFNQGQAVYLLFETPGPNEGEGQVVTGTSTSLVTMGTESSTCHAYGAPRAGTYTAYILELTSSVTSTQGSKVFTVVPIYVVDVYADSGCSATSTASFSQGADAYVQFEMPGVVGGQVYIARIVNSTYTTNVIAGYTGLASTSTCHAYFASNTGTYTGVLVESTNSPAPGSSTLAFQEFTVGSSGVPDLSSGVLPLLFAIAVAYLLARRGVRTGGQTLP